ncbi:hypothetical protein GH714_001327 [Hevea brasiliensis]|uniref:GAG-pre-integrase domain-containing protein n=1 Tax=Hevea brasiliensis TaxID=3981 RepID=A0A6A6KH02_HEVBR|nr:hypothetical protein GH714_001327 [Hevea brasiliensis]
MPYSKNGWTSIYIGWVIESGIDEPKADEALTDAQQIELEKMKLKDLEAKNYLFQAIDRPILETIFIKETSKAIWDSMKKKYQGSSRVKRAQLQAIRRDFETLQMKDGESVTSYCARTMEISNKMRFHGKVDMEIRTKNGFIEKISNVLYVPNLKSNLLSAGQLQEKGYIITIQKDACENRLFPLKIETVRSCLVAEVKDPSWLWHFRYGHLSFGGLKTPQQKNMVTRLPQIITPS